MFKFLKDKLKSAISKISENVEKSAKIEDFLVEGKVEEKTAEKPAEKEQEKREDKGFFARLRDKIAGKDGAAEESAESKKEIKPITLEKTGKEGIKPEITAHKEKEAKKHEEPVKKEPEAPKKIEEEEPGKKGLFESIKEKIITTKIDESQFEKLFWDLELALMENNVAVEVIEKIKNDLKEQLVEKPIRRAKVEATIALTLKSSIEGLFQNNSINLINEIKNKKEKPYVIAFFGINGSGKTTSIAKLASMLKDNKVSCVLAASDTFRAASIEQLQQHADKIGVKIIKHNYGADPAAVAFDAIKHARAKNIDAVLIDTAGRMHSNVNLIDELKKITRVAKPDLKIFVGESIAGNDCVEQAKTFNEAVGIDGIILAKADIDEKGGAAVSVSYVTKKPILYLGTGQKYSDLQEFDSGIVVKGLGLA